MVTWGPHVNVLGLSPLPWYCFINFALGTYRDCVTSVTGVRNQTIK